MSQENVEVVLSLYDAVQRQDYESPFEVCDENILWDRSGFGLPDMAKLYRGHDGIRELRAWLAAWETIELKALAAEDHGDHVVVKVEQSVVVAAASRSTSTTSRPRQSATWRRPRLPSKV